MRLLTSLIALAMAVGSFGVPGAVKSIDTTGVEVSFAPLTAPGTVQPGQDLVLDGSVSNPTTTLIPAGTASVYLESEPVTSTKELASWLTEATDGSGASGKDRKPGSLVASVAIPEVPAGRTVATTVTVPAASLGLTAESPWGARELAVRVQSGGTTVGESHSSIVWYPGGTVPSTRVAVAVPLTVPHETTGLIPVDLLEQYTAPEGLLSQELDQARDSRIALGIDPLIIASINVLGTSAPSSVKAWQDRLRLISNDTFALNYADSDLSVVAQAERLRPQGSQLVLAPTSFPVDPKFFPPTATPSPTGTTTPSPTPTGAPAQTAVPTAETLLSWNYTLSGIAWPQDDTIADGDLDAFAASGLTSTILDSGNVSYGELSTTPNANGRIGERAALVSNSTISGLLRKASAAPTSLEWEQAISSLSSALATVSRERPADTRTILATLGRDAPGNNLRLHDTTAAIAALPWTGTSTVKDLTGGTAGAPVTAALVSHPVPTARTSQVRALLDAEDAADTLAPLLADPTVLTGERRLSLLALLSNNWRGQDDAWNRAIAGYVKRSGELSTAVAISRSGFVVLSSSLSSIPVTVRNKLDWPVTINITLSTPKGIVAIEKSRVLLTVEADSQATARIPVQAVANGTVDVQAAIFTPKRVEDRYIPIGVPVSIPVDVSAGWETGITLALAILVVGVFGFGIWRNVAKRRKARRARRAGADSAGSATDEGHDPDQPETTEPSPAAQPEDDQR